jgi:tetratricopeptide (TPR) repeat protein/tRNA A-37 threonylcarbamoyl transferase component Bud32
MIEKLISHYRIINEIGRGGMGEVFLAEDTKLKRQVALKFLPRQMTADAEVKERFEREAQAAAALNHPNIVTVYEIGEHEGQVFIAMEYVEGQTLKKMISGSVGAYNHTPLPITHHPLPITQVIDIAIQLASSLAAAHAKGIVHRDLKPANIMVSERGQVKIVDFGLAKLAGSRTKLTQSGTTLGTVAYMSPEQTLGKDVDGRSDIWSLGAILYEMLSGQPPFQGDYPQAVIYAILNETPHPVSELRPEIPEELEAVVRKTLEKERDRRFASPEALITGLRLAAKELKARQPRKQEPQTGSDQAAVPGKAPVPAAEITVRLRRNRLRLPLLALAAFSAAGIGLWKIVPRRSAVAPRERIENSIAVIVFDNLTGDPAFDKLSIAIPNLLITNLEQTGFFQVVTWERLHDLLKQAGKDDVQAIDRELGLELCRREGVQAIVVGSFIKTGDLFTTDVKVLDVESKKLLTTAKSSGDGEASIVRSQVDELSMKIARGVGLTARKVRSVQWQVADVTTASMESYSIFLKGRENLERYYFDDARRDLEQAVNIDPTFASAYLLLSRAHGGLRDINSQTESLKKAREYAGRTTEKERLYIEAEYASIIEKNPERRRAILEELTGKYPLEKNAWYALGVLRRQGDDRPMAMEYMKRALALDPQYGFALAAMSKIHADEGEYDQAMKYAQRMRAAAPDDAAPHELLGNLFFKMGRLDEAIAEFERTMAIKPDYSGAELIALVSMIKGDFPGALRSLEQWSRHTSSPGVKARAYIVICMIDHLTGRYSQCDNDMRQGRELMQAMGNRYGEGVYALTQSQFDLERGKVDAGRRNLLVGRDLISAGLPAESKTYQAVYHLFSAQFDCLEGDWASAKRNMTEAGALLPRADDQNMRLSGQIGRTVSQYQAEVLLAEGRAREAIATLTTAPQPIIPNLDRPEIMSHNFPFLKDTLARAYIRTGELDKAIRMYESLLTFDPKSAYRRYLHPKYWYRLAKLLDQKGQGAQAAAAYEKFLELWDRADPGLPEIVDARSRLEILRKS